MNWFNNLAFKRKVQLPLGVIGLALLALVITAAQSQWQLSAVQQEISDLHLPILSTVLEADRDMHQVLIAERTALLTAPGSAEYARLMDDHRSNLQQASDRVGRVRTLDSEQVLRAQLSTFFTEFERWKKASERVLKVYGDQGQEAALVLSHGEAQAAFDAARGLLDQITEIETNASAAAAAAGQVTRQRAEWALMLMSAVGLGVCVVTFLFLPGLITVRIRRILDRIVDIAEGDGDLRQRVDDGSRDEIGQLASAFNRFADRIHDLVFQVKESALAIATGVSEIATGNMDLSQRTEEQAASLEETASSMDEMTSTVRQNAQNAREASELAEASRKQAEDGGAVVSRAISAMSEINQSSHRISDIIGVVDEIAFQTNLLALNAAVEAARAGEQGRGFAVVAAEVRSLAQRSAGAAKEIKQLIQESVQRVDGGSKLVDESGAMLTGIVAAVNKVSSIVADIDSASQEQSLGIEQVNKAVVQMDHVTQQNAALVEEAAAAARALEDQSESLRSLMAAFKLDEKRHLAAAPATAAAAGGNNGNTVSLDAQRRTQTARAAARPVPSDNLARDWSEF